MNINLIFKLKRAGVDDILALLWLLAIISFLQSQHIKRGGGGGTSPFFDLYSFLLLCMKIILISGILSPVLDVEILKLSQALFCKISSVYVQFHPVRIFIVLSWWFFRTYRKCENQIEMSLWKDSQEDRRFLFTPSSKPTLYYFFKIS